MDRRRTWHSIILIAVSGLHHGICNRLNNHAQPRYVDRPSSELASITLGTVNGPEFMFIIQGALSQRLSSHTKSQSCRISNVFSSLPSITFAHVGVMSLAAILQPLIHAGNDMYVLRLCKPPGEPLTHFTFIANPLRFVVFGNLPKFVQSVETISRPQYYASAGEALLFFDYLLTLPDEVRLICL